MCAYGRGKAVRARVCECLYTRSLPLGVALCVERRTCGLYLRVPPSGPRDAWFLRVYPSSRPIYMPTGTSTCANVTPKCLSSPPLHPSHPARFFHLGISRSLCLSRTEGASAPRRVDYSRTPVYLCVWDSSLSCLLKNDPRQEDALAFCASCGSGSTLHMRFYITRRARLFFRARVLAFQIYCTRGPGRSPRANVAWLELYHIFLLLFSSMGRFHSRLFSHLNLFGAVYLFSVFPCFEHDVVHVCILRACDCWV